MIHELRVYHAMPGRMPDLLRRFETTSLKLFEKHGIRQVGMWTTLIGPSNLDLVYILEWNSLAEREERWGAFQKDPDWSRARTASEEHGPLIASVTNTILQPTSFSALQ